MGLSPNKMVDPTGLLSLLTLWVSVCSESSDCFEDVSIVPCVPKDMWSSAGQCRSKEADGAEVIELWQRGLTCHALVAVSKHDSHLCH